MPKYIITVETEETLGNTTDLSDFFDAYSDGAIEADVHVEPADALQDGSWNDDVLIMIVETLKELDREDTDPASVPPMCYNDWIRRVVKQRDDECDSLRKEAAWWAGEGQEDRPEIIEWRALAAMKNRTPEQTARVKELAAQIRTENDNG